MEHENGKIAVAPGEGEMHMSFLGSLIWPIIDTYWTATVFIMSLLPNKFVQETTIFDKVSSNI